MQSKREIGKYYEEQPALYLEKKGYRIVDRNVNYRWGEIDLVVIDPDRNELAFVEVRSRKNYGMLAPEETVGKSKLKRLNRAIDTYLVSNQLENKGAMPTGVRIDLVAFDGSRVVHWVNFV